MKFLQKNRNLLKKNLKNRRKDNHASIPSCPKTSEKTVHKKLPGEKCTEHKRTWTHTYSICQNRTKMPNPNRNLKSKTLTFWENRKKAKTKWQFWGNSPEKLQPKLIIFKNLKKNPKKKSNRRHKKIFNRNHRKMFHKKFNKNLKKKFKDRYKKNLKRSKMKNNKRNHKRRPKKRLKRNPKRI